MDWYTGNQINPNYSNWYTHHQIDHNHKTDVARKTDHKPHKDYNKSTKTTEICILFLLFRSRNTCSSDVHACVSVCVRAFWSCCCWKFVFISISTRWFWFLFGSDVLKLPTLSLVKFDISRDCLISRATSFRFQWLCPFLSREYIAPEILSDVRSAYSYIYCFIYEAIHSNLWSESDFRTDGLLLKTSANGFNQVKDTPWVRKRFGTDVLGLGFKLSERKLFWEC